MICPCPNSGLLHAPDPMLLLLLLLLLFHTPIGADEKDEKGNREIRMIDV